MLNNAVNLPITQITDPASPMRTDIDVEPVRELADSIKLNGLINPITVRPKGELYEVVAGHRRFKACQIVPLQEIPCIIRDLNDNDVIGIMAAENLERQDVDPVDEAIFIGKIVQMEGEDINTISKRLNRSVQWVSDRLDILEYPAFLIGALKSGQIKIGVAKWLGRITDEVYCKMYTDSAVKNGMSVSQAEYAYRQFEMGLMPSVDTIMPPPSELAPYETPKARAVCARCGTIAIEPNLRIVYVHTNCPADENNNENKTDPPSEPA